MKVRETLARLRDLRRLREQRAREDLARGRQVVLNAAQKVRGSAEAIAQETARAEIEEENTFTALAGSVVSTIRLHEMQHRFDAVAGRLQGLQVQDAEARDLEQKSRDEFAAARKTYRLQRWKLEKLENVMEQTSLREHRKQVARAELSEEDNPNSSEVANRGPGI